MNKNRRWMTSVLASSRDVAVQLPWARGARREPQALRLAAAMPAKAQAVAAAR